MAEQTVVVPRVPPQARKVNRFRREDGKALVSLVAAEGDLKSRVRQAVDLIGGLDRLVRPGDSILLKPNFNSGDPPPASTDLGFLRAVVDLLKEAGAGQITIGESSGIYFGPTRKVLDQLGVPRLIEDLGVRLVMFDEDEWVEVEINGQFLRTALLPRVAYEADKVIYLPCLKTHNSARFTLGLKLAFGYTHLSERMQCHADHIEDKVAEVNLAWQPDLILMDGRKAFVTEGPMYGELVEPGLILASGDLVALDVEAIRILQSYPAQNLLTMGPWEMAQVRAAIRHGLGVSGPDEYVVVRS